MFVFEIKYLFSLPNSYINFFYYLLFLFSLKINIIKFKKKKIFVLYEKNINQKNYINLYRSTNKILKKLIKDKKIWFLNRVL